MITAHILYRSRLGIIFDILRQWKGKPLYFLGQSLRGARHSTRRPHTFQSYPVVIWAWGTNETIGSVHMHIVFERNAFLLISISAHDDFIHLSCSAHCDKKATVIGPNPIAHKDHSVRLDHMNARTPPYILSRVYFRGMKREEWVAPIPGRPCLTGLLCGC